jgi:hypothetical protein
MLPEAGQPSPALSFLFFFFLFPFRALPLLLPPRSSHRPRHMHARCMHSLAAPGPCSPYPSPFGHGAGSADGVSVSRTGVQLAPGMGRHGCDLSSGFTAIHDQQACHSDKQESRWFLEQVSQDKLPATAEIHVLRLAASPQRNGDAKAPASLHQQLCPMPRGCSPRLICMLLL